MKSVLNRLSRAGARLVVASKAIDRAYRMLDTLRSELVLGVASDTLLDRFNELAYGGDAGYQPNSSNFRSHLFPWEEKAIRDFFPAAPSRLLVGGAGGGREAFVLAEMGYEVVAFEPSEQLAGRMAAALPSGTHVQVYRAGYEDLPRLFSIEPHQPATSLHSFAPFDAAIIGWASFSHLRTAEQRVKTLKAFRAVTRGPVLVSFLQFRAEPHMLSPGRARVRRLLRGRFNQEPGNAFSIGLGFYHEMTREEITATAAKAGLKIAVLNMDIRDTNWPHAVLLASSTPA